MSLEQALKSIRPIIFWVIFFSVFTNVLMLTGPIYMLQIYDRVLISQSIQTLTALTLVIIFLYACHGLLDFVRSRAMTQASAILQETLDKQVFQASISAHVTRGSSPVRDLETIQKFMASPAYLALFDIFWTPLFLLGILVFHPWLGYLAIAGGLILLLLAILGQFFSRKYVSMAVSASRIANKWSDYIGSEAEEVKCLGMSEAVYQKWSTFRLNALLQNVLASNKTAAVAAFTKTFRLLLQSLMLGLGAYLVILGELTPGAMIAGTILLGRALAPVELLLSHWSSLLNFQQAKRSLKSLLVSTSTNLEKIRLPTPEHRFEVNNLYYEDPKTKALILENVNFSIVGGQALGVIGASGSGKTTLARLIAGAFLPSDGEIRLGGAKLEFYRDRCLASYIGYMPQSVKLYPGSVGENIALLTENPDNSQIVQAAKDAAAYDIIMQLEYGFDTIVENNTPLLSGGQIQRLGLARALYSDPLLLILDEPNSNLDHDGSRALNFSIKQQKALNKMVIIMAHRPSAIIECDLLLVLEKGKVVGFGQRDDILKKYVKNYEAIKNDG
jgi:PrtD family type I secretion system ABC transporter